MSAAESDLPTIQRTREMAAQYCRLGSLAKVATHYGITPERVRQILVIGRACGWCKYSPRERRCNALSLLPEALRTAQSWKDLTRKIGIPYNANIKQILEQVGISADEVARRIKWNRDQYFLDLLREQATRLGVSDTFSMTVLLGNSQGKRAYMNVRRRLGWGISDIRKHFGLNPQRPDKGVAR